MMFRPALTMALMLSALFTNEGAMAASVTMYPTQDTTIFSDNESHASGVGGFAFAGTTASGTFRRALISFDLSAIAPGSQVTMVTFSLTVDRATGGIAPMALHRLLASWGTGASDGGTSGAGALAQPGDATWSHRRFGDLSAQWEDGTGALSAGGWFVPTPSATRDVGGPDTYVWSATLAPGSNHALVADVQDWVDRPDTNFGWILVGDEANDRSAKRFYSADAPDLLASLRPTLTIDVTPVPEPQTFVLIGAGAILLARRLPRLRPFQGGSRMNAQRVG